MDTADHKPRRKLSWPSIVLYISIFIGLIGVATYLTDEVQISEEIVISGIFALLGGASFVMLLRDRKLVWRILTTVLWSLTLVGFGGYLIDTVNLHEGLVMALIMPSIGALIYGLFSFYPKHTAPPSQAQFRQLGSPEQRIDPLQDYAARDVGVEQRGR